MTDLRSIPFAKLVASDAINARSTGGKDGLDELAASILSEGLIQPLAVRPADGGGDRYEIIDGRRRWQALSKLVKDGRRKKGDAVPCNVLNVDDIQALQSSLAANVVRLPMHPVDQHEVFAGLVEKGRTPADLAASFGLAERTVKQHLALGRLAPEVRKAWRDGTLDAVTAQAFAIHPDAKVQAATLAKLKASAHRGTGVQVWDVRRELSDTRQLSSQSDELALVGEKAYIAAGGVIDDDLFRDARYIADVPLVKKLARDIMLAKRDELRKAGWAWAEIAGDVDFEDWQCRHVLVPEEDDTGEDYDFTPQQRARSGCLVSIDTDELGKTFIDVRTGLIRPSAQRDIEDPDDDEHGDLPSPRSMLDDPGAQSPEGASEDDPFSVSGALLETITTAQTVAAAAALEQDAALALRVIVATLATGRPYDSPCKVSISHEVPGRPFDIKNGFAKLLGRLGRIDQREALVELAVLVSQSVQLAVKPGGRQIADAQAFVDSLDADAYLDQMRRAMPYADYFARASKATAVEALDEMRAGGHRVETPAASLSGMKKADLAAYATEQAKACGWLPPQLRNAGYGLIVPEPKPRRGKMAAAEQTSEPETEAPAPRKGRAKVRA